MATTTALPRKKIQSRNKVSQDIPDIPQRTRELFLYAIALFSLLTGFFFNSPKEILDGLLRIQLSPSVLLSDFMEIGNIGAAFVNSALMMLLYTRVAKRSGTLVSGPLMASLLTIGGFADIPVVEMGELTQGCALTGLGHARQAEIDAVVKGSDTIEGSALYPRGAEEGKSAFSGSGIYRYIVPEDEVQASVVLTQLRLKHVADSDSHRAGHVVESLRRDGYLAYLRSMEVA